MNYVWHMYTGIITLSCSDCVTWHNTGHRIVETASQSTSQVSDLISFPNSPSLLPSGSCVNSDKAYKGLSASVRIQWHGWGEHEEVKFIWVQADVCRPPHIITHLPNSTGFSPQDAQYTECFTVHCTQVNHLPCVWVTTVAFVLHILAITFRSHKDENKTNTSRTMAMLKPLSLVVNSLLSSPPAPNEGEIGWNSST